MVRATVALISSASAQAAEQKLIDDGVLSTTWPLTPCAAGNYRCMDGVSCVDLSTFCDGITDCADASDEAVCSRLRDAFEEAKPRLRRQGTSANPNYVASSDSKDRIRRQFDFPAFTTANPFGDFFSDVTTEGFMEFFGGATTDSLGDGLFNFATTGFPLDFGAVQTTASPFGDGDLFFNPTTQSPLVFPSFTTESMLDFFGAATEENPFLGNLLTTAGLFPGMLQTTEASFIFPPAQTTVPSFEEPLLVATTEEALFALPTTPAPVFPSQTTEDTFELPIATTPEPAFPAQTTEGLEFPELQTTGDPFVFPEQTTAGFDLGLLGTTQGGFPDGLLATTQSGFPDDLLATTEGGFPDGIFPATTADPLGGIFGPTTEGFVFPDFQTTPFPSITTEGLPLFPEVTTESLEFPVFTTASPNEVDSGDFFTCANGDRVFIDVVCDKIADCLDGSDELNCPEDTTEDPTTTSQRITTTVEPDPTTETTTTATTSTTTTSTTAGTTIPARVPSSPPQEADEEQYERWFDTFMNWRAAIFNDWLNVMKVYQQRSGITTDDNSSCSSASLSFCSNGRKTCKDDLDGCQYCFCELSKADLANRDLVEDQFARDLDFWELRLQQQWYNLWNRYTMEESEEL